MVGVVRWINQHQCDIERTDSEVVNKLDDEVMVAIVANIVEVVDQLSEPQHVWTRRIELKDKLTSSILELVAAFHQRIDVKLRELVERLDLDPIEPAINPDGSISDFPDSCDHHSTMLEESYWVCTDCGVHLASNGAVIYDPSKDI